MLSKKFAMPTIHSNTSNQYLMHVEHIANLRERMIISDFYQAKANRDFYSGAIQRYLGLIYARMRGYNCNSRQKGHQLRLTIDACFQKDAFKVCPNSLSANT